jgi:hypothetical protein
MKKCITLLFVFISSLGLAQPCVPNTNSLNFNGTSNSVTITSQNNLNMTDSVTVEAWIYVTQFKTTSADGSIFCKHSWSSGESGYVLRAGGAGILSFNLKGDSLGLPATWKEVTSPAGALTLNTWYHVAGTFDGNNLKLYINGLLVATRPFVGGIIPSGFNPVIGRLSDTGQPSPSRYWNGRIDEIRVFHRALSQTEIADSMGVHIDPASQNALVGYWRLNEGSGTLINDLSVSVNSGTISGASWTTLVPFNAAPSIPTISFIGGQLVASSSPNYQWSRNGTIIPGATLQTYVPTLNGTYTVSVTNGTCVSTSNPYSLTSVGIVERSGEELLLLTPSPAHEYLEVHLSITDAINNFEITDIAGRRLYAKANVSGDRLRVTLTGFSKGIYFAKMTNAVQTIIKKFVVE